jgi:hypothetical protein
MAYLYIYLFSVVACYFLIVWSAWFVGDDIDTNDVVSMFFISAIPILNVYIAMLMFAEAAKLIFITSSKPKVVIKGRKKS